MRTHEDWINREDFAGTKFGPLRRGYQSFCSLGVRLDEVRSVGVGLPGRQGAIESEVKGVRHGRKGGGSNTGIKGERKRKWMNDPTVLLPIVIVDFEVVIVHHNPTETGAVGESSQVIVIVIVDFKVVIVHQHHSSGGAVG